MALPPNAPSSVDKVSQDGQVVINKINWIINQSLINQKPSEQKELKPKRKKKKQCSISKQIMENYGVFMDFIHSTGSWNYLLIKSKAFAILQGIIWCQISHQEQVDILVTMNSVLFEVIVIMKEKAEAIKNEKYGSALYGQAVILRENDSTSPYPSDSDESTIHTVSESDNKCDLKNSGICVSPNQEKDDLGNGSSQYSENKESYGSSHEQDCGESNPDHDEYDESANDNNYCESQSDSSN